MTDPLIRPATTADAPALTACFSAAYAPWRARLPDLPDVSGGLDDDIRDHMVFVAEDDSGLLAGIVLVQRGDVLHVANLAVHPQASGRGLARRLMDAAEAQARASGCHRMYLATHRDMPGNVALYRHLGWRVVETGPRKVTMEKGL
ncbi:GNAT family N-acetyltransferase [Fluviibacterium sp. DFM31]|uniref:GNAT family N-acetyltransferase n=1 Tax=Meridianimarinicoccus marinus TaxID=3231483 RepID=A0ABV3L2D8_9RHOB